MMLPRDRRTLSYPYVANRSKKDQDGTLYGRHFGRIRNEGAGAATATKTINGVPVPATPAELAECVADPDKWAKVTATPELREEFFTEYNRLVNKGDSIAKQVEEQVSAVLVETLKEWGIADSRKLDFSDLTDELKQLRPGPGGAQKSATYNPRAMGAQIDDMFENSGEFFATIWHNRRHDEETVQKLDRLRNAFSENVPSEGGFLVPETLRSELLRVSLETAIVRPRARVIPMETLRVPFPSIDSTSNVSSVFGGIVAYWTEEGATLTASNPKFGRIVLEAKKLSAYTEVPNELVADSISSFQALIDDLFPEALAFYEDDAFMNGAGTGEPLGFLNAGNAAAVEVAKESGQAADTILWENIVKAYARMLPGSLGRAVWIASIDTFPELATMALSVGTGGSAIWLNNGAQGPPMTILGRPVIFTEKAPVLGDAGDINFVDLGFYLIGDRQAMSARSSEHYKFKDDVTAYRIIERVDGRPWLQSAITPKNGGDTLSPFVKVAARA